MKEGDILIIVAVLVLLMVFVFWGFGMMGFGGMMHNYGISGVCSTIGGIWCYWPSWISFFAIITWTLVIIAFVLVIVWLTKKVSNPKNR
jgi:protein-S-isoprenylcysteine O-methyltransferase Ste14